MRGYRLVGPGEYQAIPPAAEGGLWLSSIDLRVVGEQPPHENQGARLRFYTRAGDRLPHTDEEADLRLAERDRRIRAEAATVAEREQRARAEEAAREDRERGERAEARAARLRELLAEHGIAEAEPES